MIYMHKHHIMPRHMGGTDDPNNLLTVNVALHAFLHKILWEEHGYWQDLAAWKGLSGQTPYRIIDEEIEKNRREKISKKLQGRLFSEETRKRMSISAKKRSNTIEGRNRLISIAPVGNKKHTEETKQKCRLAHLGKPKTQEHKDAMKKPKSVKLGWFTDGKTNLKLRLTDVIPENFYRGRTF